ncbi:hypothetical protein CMK21_08460 [Candidatus Poribacteria bacterium]|jgi:flagellar hook assembly protein FlgD|nr:hypothetical protein [Candidatus Poribacteria bacterium]|tara:strand:+ start:306 stop:506 length:201 start_codon:yes stop_codon:yes gene_type:complete
MISIYNINGVVVSCLKLSQQKAGNYLVRDMAAYWDGRSMNGELVSSGGVLLSDTRKSFFSLEKNGH